jgi:tyrosine aminotransferase
MHVIIFSYYLSDFLAAPESKAALKKALDRDTFSYMSCAGLESSREAVAEYVNQNYKSLKSQDDLQPIAYNDIVLTSGCSMALEMCFRVLANPGDNILFPTPCMGYSTWIVGCGIDVRYFNLDPMKEWEVDLNHLESMINDKTKAILINNPGNPW